jgi:hypothetical protein
MTTNQEDKVKSGCSRTRAFFSVLLVGLFINGMARSGSPRSVDYIYSTSLTLWFGGVIGSSFFAIKFRNESSYWSAAWKTHLIFIGTTFLLGLWGANLVLATSAAIAGLFAGALMILPGVALFYWRNLITNIILGLLISLIVISVAAAIFYRK